MARYRISSLQALTLPEANDLLCIVDVSDTTGNSSGTSKKIALSHLYDHLLSGHSPDSYFEQDFSNQTSLRVEHNLGKIPSVHIFNEATGKEFEASIDIYTAGDELNILDVSWNVSLSGKVVCN